MSEMALVREKLCKHENEEWENGRMVAIYRIFGEGTRLTSITL